MGFSMLVLELGSGASPTLRPDATVVHLDLVESAPHVELVADLDDGIPCPSNVFDEVLALDILEHLTDVVAIMDECHRVLVDGGRLHLRVPLWGGPWHVTDPTHVRGFGAESFDFFDSSKPLGAGNGSLYTSRRWRIESKAEANHNLVVTMAALKPGESRREWGLRPA